MSNKILDPLEGALEEAFEETLGKFYKDADNIGHPVPPGMRAMFRAIFYTGAAAAGRIFADATIGVLTVSETEVRTLIKANKDDLGDVIQQIENNLKKGKE